MYTSVRWQQVREEGLRGNPVLLPREFLVVPEALRRRETVRAVPVVEPAGVVMMSEEFKEEAVELLPVPAQVQESDEEEERPGSLPISSDDKVLAVHEGSLYRARLRGSSKGLGVTVKSTSDGRIVVHALPRPNEKQRGQAEAAGVKVGDELLGMGEDFFEKSMTLAELVARIKARPEVLLILKRGQLKSGETRMASLLRDQSVIDDVQASVLSSMMAHLEDRLEAWDSRADLLAGSFSKTTPRRRFKDDFSDLDTSSVQQHVRPALCVRILGTDYLEDHTVYIIWVLDVLAGAEWRVQRRFREFFELHEQLVGMRPSMEKLDFPMRRPSIYETVHSVNDRRVRLERHLRRVSGMLFSARLHNKSPDVALALETFLDVPKRRASLELLERNPDLMLRQAVQVAVFQLLALPVFEKIVSDVVNSLLHADLESGADLLSKMKAYIDHLQHYILDGASDFLRAVALRRQPRIPEDDLASLMSAAVRRQIETDVFVPLMDKLHALLERDVHHLDATLQYKCRAARSRPQSFFGIPLHQISPSSWESAIYQLANIASYTLPCDKLDALLAAAKEIPNLYIAEHPGTNAHLGADDFLPIFIYVLINANIPLLYLKIILCALCDPDKKLSETGYYLATFEAAVQHISELEL
ncbi:hypothetical protein CTAYLR_001750 [Chrysophaeum taylorii]|uniref:VPS9 domain-containing protein n=1 Tax=Chrysophaeum taylorii TaxID=2483200 RepID=A0AAD7XMB4_9STRA|nr:hypothetical protein CTAYLR_001750 [Chrysophaeum taylorii]